MKFLRNNCSREELFLVFLAIGMGILLRASKVERLAVEHFDEAVYASSVWYSGPDGEAYPMRHLYAPPLLPSLIRLCHDLSGGHPAAPFIPGIVLGCLTLFVSWLMCRVWFGMNAGLFVVFVASFSDFHIIFSRMALTDVPVLCLILAASGVASVGLQKQSVRWMVVAGLLTGLGWWIKYTGWLALAIVFSGSGLWWILKGRRTISPSRFGILLGAMAVTAGFVWAPWLWSLSDVGGYSAVRENHAGYFSGFDGWQERLVDHLIYHFRFESWFGAACLGLGAMAAGTRRWIQLRLPGKINSPDPDPAKTPRLAPFPPASILGRFVLASVGLAVVGLSMGGTILLLCMTVAGLAGAFLWPVLSQLYEGRSNSRVAPKPTEHPVAMSGEDVRTAPAIDPTLGLCLTTSWVLGMLLTTPMYQAFPRLSLPLLCALWFGAAAGLGWWMEAVLNFARAHHGVTDQPKRGQRPLRMLAVVALALAVTNTLTINIPRVWQHRTSLRDAAHQLAAIAIQDSRGEYEPDTAPLNLDAHGNLTPNPPGDADEGITTQSRLRSRLAVPVDPAELDFDSSKAECVIFGYGEPAVLAHIQQAGIPASPVAHTSFAAVKTRAGEELPNYLVVGPNALRTPDFMNSWITEQYRFRHVADVWFAPSEVVLYNLFSPTWVGQHAESSIQKLELYRLDAGPDQDVSLAN